MIVETKAYILVQINKVVKWLRQQTSVRAEVSRWQPSSHTLAVEERLRIPSTNLHANGTRPLFSALSPEEVEQMKESYLKAKSELLSEDDGSEEIVIPVPIDRRPYILEHDSTTICMMIKGPASIRAMWTGAKEIRRQNIQARWDTRKLVRERSKRRREVS